MKAYGGVGRDTRKWGEMSDVQLFSGPRMVWTVRVRMGRNTWEIMCGKGKLLCLSSFDHTGQLSTFLAHKIVHVLLPLANTMDGRADWWMDGWREIKEMRHSGSERLGGFTNWAEFKCYQRMLADSMAPLITFSKSWIEGPSQSHYRTRAVCHLPLSISPVHPPPSLYYHFI